MDKKRQQQLKEKGFRVGSAADFLELSPEEEAYIDILSRFTSIPHPGSIVFPTLYRS